MRIAAFSLAMAFSFCVMPQNVWAEEVGMVANAGSQCESGFEYEISDDKQVTITGYNGNDTDIVIPQDINGMPVIIIGYAAFEDCTNLTSIAIPNSVTTIGTSAFSECTGLTSVIIPDSVEKIENFAFYGCSNITEVRLSSNLKSIGANSFFHHR